MSAASRPTSRRLKHTEQELAAAKIEAERASRAKSQFLAAISHDMRQPIQAASLFLGVLDGRIGDLKAREVLERVKTSIDSVHGMLERPARSVTAGRGIDQASA